MLLAKIGIINADSLKEKRKFAVVIIFILAAAPDMALYQELATARVTWLLVLERYMGAVAA